MKGRKIVVGVTGSIAAFKAAEIVSQLVQKGASVTCIMTDGAMQFITPLTFQTLTGNKVLYKAFDMELIEDPTHIKLAKSTELLLIAPATANFIGKMAGGIADDLLSSFVLAVSSPILIAPAMNENMYKNKIVQENIESLKKKGYIIISPATGFLACGDIGVGRLADVETIIKQVESTLIGEKKYLGK